MNPHWIVSQIGARQHYGIPVAFQRAGQLRRFYTEAWVGRGRWLLARAPRPLRSFATRYHPELPRSKVVAFTSRTLRDLFADRHRGRSLDETYDAWLRAGRRFDEAVADDLARQRLDPATDVFFGFNTGCLASLSHVRGRGVVGVCDQIDPGKVEDDLVRAEAAKWPGWQRDAGQIPDAYWNHMRQEWAAADVVVVNSNWSRSALIQQGVPADKLAVVPVAYEPAGPPPPPRPVNADRPLTVLWLGAVNLRKGIPYLIDAARQLERSHPRVRFVVAGPMLISAAAVASAPSTVQFVGTVTRTETADLYRRADLFVLPTISDGFAITQVEAMAQGVPVVTTPHCGDVVTDGVDGRIVPAADAAALAAAIAELDDDRRRLADMSPHALRRSRDFSLAAQTRQLNEAVAQVGKDLSTKNTKGHEG